MNTKPFLKWAGGKTQLLNDIKKLIPFSEKDSFTYIEPFVGSGAVLFWMLNRFQNIEKVVINDINTDLINCYKTIKNDVVFIIKTLREYENHYNSLDYESIERTDFFYKHRDLFNQRRLNNIEQATLFIFLNKTCFNGLHRVNSRNEFNVPQGDYKKPKICDENNLLSVSRLLQKVEILNTDFIETIHYADNNSLYYLDPPYKPLSKTSNFNSYVKNEFNDEEQVRLKTFCDQLDRNGIRWILSNSDVKGCDPQSDFFDKLYCSYNIKRVRVNRFINSNSEKRGKITELLITNNLRAANAF